MLGEAERREKHGQRSFTHMWRDKPDVLLDRAPRQQPGLLKDHAEFAMRRQRDAALKIAIQPDDDAQKRRFAAT